MSAPSPTWRHAAPTFALGAALLVFSVVVLRCAWMSDDAFITLRSVDNLVHGYGLRWNPSERVQAFTHPLWMLLLIPGHALTGSAYYAPLALSFVVSLLAAGLAALRLAPTRGAGALLLLVLTSSKAYVDFSTSGLENPLSHLLLVVFLLEALQGRPRWRLGLWAGLAACNRLDLALLFAPLVALLLIRSSPRERLQLLAAGAAPLLAWHSFSLIYYGFLLPNTAYAKLGTGLPRGALLRSGLRWLGWAARTDPATLLALVLGGLSALSTRKPPFLALLTGVALYILYVVSIGGDFMGDRFLSVPLLCAAIAIAQLPLSPTPRALAPWATAAVCLLSLSSPWSPWRSGPEYTKAPPGHGVVDERGYYWRGAGLWSPRSHNPMPSHPFAREGLTLRGSPTPVVKATIGFLGYAAGPQAHIVDPLGLADPLTARLPARYKEDWRVGHFRREIPEGYLLSIQTGEARLADPELNDYYQALKRITQGPLLSVERWKTIAKMNTGGYRHLVVKERWRHPGITRVSASQDLGMITPRGLILNVQGDHGLTVDLGRRVPWTLRYEAHGALIGTARVPALPHPRQVEHLRLPRGTEQVLLFPARKSHAYLVEATP